MFESIEKAKSIIQKNIENISEADFLLEELDLLLSESVTIRKVVQDIQANIDKYDYLERKKATTPFEELHELHPLHYVISLLVDVYIEFVFKPDAEKFFPKIIDHYINSVVASSNAKLSISKQELFFEIKRGLGEGKYPEIRKELDEHLKERRIQLQILENLDRAEIITGTPSEQLPETIKNSLQGLLDSSSLCSLYSLFPIVLDRLCADSLIKKRHYNTAPIEKKIIRGFDGMKKSGVIKIHTDYIVKYKSNSLAYYHLSWPQKNNFKPSKETIDKNIPVRFVANRIIRCQIIFIRDDAGDIWGIHVSPNTLRGDGSIYHVFHNQHIGLNSGNIDVVAISKEWNEYVFDEDYFKEILPDKVKVRTLKVINPPYARNETMHVYYSLHENKLYAVEHESERSMVYENMFDSLEKHDKNAPMLDGMQNDESIQIMKMK